MNLPSIGLNQKIRDNVPSDCINQLTEIQSWEYTKECCEESLNKYEALGDTVMVQYFKREIENAKNKINGLYESF